MTPDTMTKASICTDCYMYSHYRDESLGDHVTPEMEQDIKQGFDKLSNVHIADHHHTLTCAWFPYCTFYSEGNKCTGEDCTCSETYFSWSPCDICESNLGGDRHDVDIIEMGG